VGYKGEGADREYRQPGGLRYGHSPERMLHYQAQLRLTATELTLRIGALSGAPVDFRFLRSEVTRVTDRESPEGRCMAIEHACNLYPPAIFFHASDFAELREALLHFGYRLE